MVALITPNWIKPIGVNANINMIAANSPSSTKFVVFFCLHSISSFLSLKVYTSYFFIYAKI